LAISQPNKNAVMKNCDIGVVLGYVGLPKSGNPTYAAMDCALPGLKS